MSKPASTKSRSSWIVQGNGVASGRLTEHIKSDAEITQVKQVAPDVVVLTMSNVRAESLRNEFGDELVIEPDQDLKLGAGPADD